MKRSDGSMMSRRELLSLLGGIAISSQLPLSALAQEKKAGIGIALQLYTMRGPAKKDLAGTLKKCREMGWEYVQWSGMPDLPAEKIREALDTAGLKAISAHVGVEGFEKDFDGQVAFWKKVGVTHLGPGGMMRDCQDSLEAWLKGAQRFDALGAKLREVGIKLTYHNHAGEFEKYEGDPRCKLDILYESTSPEHLFAEFDLAWVYVGGADPAAYLRKYKGRCPVIHVKDLKDLKRGAEDHGDVTFMPLGRGVQNWTEIHKAAQEAGVEWYVYEQDSCEGDVFECAKISYDFLSKLVK